MGKKNLSNAIHSIAEINFDGLKWITLLRNRLCENGEITGDDINKAFESFLSDSEYKKTPKIVSHNKSISSKRRLLFKLKENQNVKGLSNNNQITFSPFFTLLYGLNGTGKTSYYEVLKDAFHSEQGIRNNIYKDDDCTPSATVSFINDKEFIKQQQKGSINGFPNSEKELHWEPNKRWDKSIKFCDKNILSKSLSKKETGWSVDEYKLGYYRKLNSGIDEVEKSVKSKIENLEQEIDKQVRLIKNSLQEDEKGSLKESLEDSERKQIKTLVEKALKRELPENLDKKKRELNHKVGREVKDLRNSIEVEETHIDKGKKILSLLKERIRIFESVSEIRNDIDKQQKLEEARDFSSFEKFELLFPVNGNDENSESYLSLLKKIGQTALKNGYSDYPEEVDKCFYCNQELPEQNKSLISDLHELVENDHQEKIDRLIKKIRNFVNRIDDLIRETPSEIDFKFSHLDEVFDVKTKSEIGLKQRLENSLKTNRLTQLKGEISKRESISLDTEKLISLTKQMRLLIFNELKRANWKVHQYTTEIEEIENIRGKAESKLNKIKDTEYLLESSEDIRETIANIEKLSHYNEEKDRFQSIRLKVTKSKSKFESSAIWDTYRTKFNGYLSKFDIPQSDNIIRDFSNPGGQSHVDTSIEVGEITYPTKEILSEGEAKIHALCDFLTEVELSDVDTLIFDDPITSLDHRYIKIFSEILAELSVDYQVIVFTHSTEFYQELINYTLGNGAVRKEECRICKLGLNEKCHGYKPNKKKVHKCGNYYKIEATYKPGYIKDEVSFQRLHYVQRLEQIRQNIEEQNTGKLSDMLRTTINNFYESFELGNVRNLVFTGHDLLTFRDRIKNNELNEEDYETLRELHSKLSGRGTMHEPTIQNKTPLDLRSYAEIYNKIVDLIRKYDSNVDNDMKLSQ